MVIVSSLDELGYVSSLDEKSSDLLLNLRDDFISQFGLDFFSSASTIIVLAQEDFFHVIKSPSKHQLPYEPIEHLSDFITP
jgi:hypothetical protein